MPANDRVFRKRDTSETRQIAGCNLDEGLDVQAEVDAHVGVTLFEGKRAPRVDDNDPVVLRESLSDAPRLLREARGISRKAKREPTA